jgi:protein tyrosine/serine phosphatase
MFASLARTLHDVERRLARSFGRDISTPRGRLAAWVHFHLFDHGILRTVWSNLDQVAPGVWRSNQPSPRRLERYHRMGIRTILNLRGTNDGSPWLFEREAAQRLGMRMIDVRLFARKLVPPEDLLALLDIFETIDRPFVMHCKSGADRAGLASALWLLHMEGAPIEIARRHLHWRYVHLDFTDTGILDHLLDAYARDTAATPMPIRTWIATRYDPAALTQSFRAGRTR